MRSLKSISSHVVLILGAITAVALTPTPTPTPTAGLVTLTEWSVTAQAVVGSGDVRFDVWNDGGTVHQLAVYRGGSLSGDAIVGGTLVARTGNILAGGTDVLPAILGPGAYWLVCPIPGHTALGMSAQLVVDGSAPPPPPTPTPTASGPSGPGGLLVGIGALALLVAAGGGAAFFVRRKPGVGA